LRNVRTEVIEEEQKGLWNSQSVTLPNIQKTKTMVVGDSRVDGLSGSNLKSTLIEK
jgi:hypothetical protein